MKLQPYVYMKKNKTQTPRKKQNLNVVDNKMQERLNLVGLGTDYGDITFWASEFMYSQN